MPNYPGKKSPSFGHASDARSAPGPIRFKAERYADDGPRRHKMAAFEGAQLRKGRTRMALDHQLMQLVD